MINKLDNREKKITLLINSLGGGGAEGVCVYLANGLSDRGWQVTLVVLHLNNSVRHDKLKKEVQLVVLNKKHARTAMLSLKKYLKQSRPDKILVFNHQLAVLLIVIRSLFFYKFSLIARNINTLSQKKANEKSLWHKYFVQGLTKLFYGKVDRVVSQSKGMADDLIQFYRISENKITIIHNPINPELECYPLSNNKKEDYLLCVGRLESQKAFHYSLLVFADIAQDYPTLRLKIVGKGSLENDLKEQAIRLGVSERVDFEGYQENIIPYYLAAKVTLLTSLYEGFPNVLIESIVLGTPVVAFDCPSGPSEIVEENSNGFLVKYRNETELTYAVRKALDKKWHSGTVRQTAASFRSSFILSKYEKVLV